MTTRQRYKEQSLKLRLLNSIWLISASVTLTWLSGIGQTQTQKQPPRYETREDHDPNGIGKFYMGREIAQVMGHEGADWLERPEREAEEEPEKLLDALKLKPGMVIADIGAGSGYLSFRMAK